MLIPTFTEEIVFKSNSLLTVSHSCCSNIGSKVVCIYGLNEIVVTMACTGIYCADPLMTLPAQNRP
jgi:hypothetical protein